MFQRTLATSRWTLAVVTLAVVAVWAVHWLVSGGSPLAYGLALLATEAAVYFLTELNNSYALLRRGGRAICALLFLLAGASPQLHTLGWPHLTLFCAVAAYFPLFAAYARPQKTAVVASAYLFLSIGSMAEPRLLWLLPMVWVAQGLLRAWSLRGLVASLLGVVTPWWLTAVAAYMTGRLPDFVAWASRLWQRPEWPDYAAPSLTLWLSAGMTLLVFLVGTADFLHTRRLDKTRTRYNYYAVLTLGAAAFLLMFLQPQWMEAVLPVGMVSAAMLGGHFVALSFGKVQNVVTIVLNVLLAAACVAGIWLS